MKYLLIITGSLLLVSCSKFREDFLNVKKDPRVSSPSTIADYQALLDNGNNNVEPDAWMNIQMSDGFGIISGDECYLTPQVLGSLAASLTLYKNLYLWDKTIYLPSHDLTRDDWAKAYKRIFYCNMVLNGIDKVGYAPSEKTAFDNVKGSGLFFRSLNLYALAQQYCKPYNEATAKTDPGLPLREDYDVSVKSYRASLFDTYQMIIRDLEIAVPLLPDRPLVKYRPSKPAAWLVLARTYLQMENYEKAGHYAGLALDSWPDLVDFNGLANTGTYVFRPDDGLTNPEIFFYCYTANSLFTTSRINVDTVLLDSYAEDDLRYNIYYAYRPASNNINFTGGYSGSSAFFSGLAADEAWLTRAECLARAGKTNEAMNDLNHLLQYRYDRNSFVPLTAADAEQALRLVLEHRRKELVLRGTRWADLRRLNKDPRFAVTLVRIKADGQRIDLPPNSPLYVLPIPEAEIDITGMEQNPR